MKQGCHKIGLRWAKDSEHKAKGRQRNQQRNRRAGKRALRAEVNKLEG